MMFTDCFALSGKLIKCDWEKTLHRIHFTWTFLISKFSFNFVVILNQMQRHDLCKAMMTFLFCFEGQPMYVSLPCKTCYMLRQILILLITSDAPRYHGQSPTRLVWYPLLLIIKLVIFNSPQNKKLDCIFHFNVPFFSLAFYRDFSNIRSL